MGENLEYLTGNTLRRSGLCL